MKKYILKALFVPILFILSTTVAICQQIISGKVVRIADGDTITILTKDNKQIRIRLFGVDCPERSQDFGNVARKFTSDKCFSKHVNVEVKDIDKYGRTVGMVVLPDNNILNKELLKAGLAWHYKRYDNSQELANLEIEARKNKIGLWRDKNPVEPWLYRRK